MTVGLFNDLQPGRMVIDQAVWMGGHKRFPTRIRVGINFDDADHSGAEITTTQGDAFAARGLACR